MPEEPTSAARAKTSRPAGRAAELKWLTVLAALLVATVIDGIAVSDVSRSTTHAVSASAQAVITLPSDRCGPGCSIMMASNQRGDRLQ